MDSTHGTNSYVFNLMSVVVIGDFGEKIPTAWMISNKEDTSTRKQLLQAVKKRTGEVAPQWFMSDDAQQYFNAWTAVFETTSLGMWIKLGEVHLRGIHQTENYNCRYTIN